MSRNPQPLRDCSSNSVLDAGACIETFCKEMKKQTQIALLLGIIGLIVVPLSVKQFAAAPTLQVKLLNGAATVLDKIGAPIKANGLRDQAERIANNRTLFILEFASNAEYEKMSEAVWDGYDQKTKYVRIRLGDDDRTMEVTVDSNAAAWARSHLLDVQQGYRRHP